MNDINEKKFRVFKKLLKSMKCENLATVQRLLKDGAINLNEWIGDMGVTALHLAVGHGTEAFAACAAHDMLRLGADANAASADGMTPVHVAAAWGRVTVLHVLLLHGGDPWRQDDERRNAFNHAFEAKAWPAVEMLHSFQLVRAAARPKCCRLSVSPVQLGEFVPSKEDSVLSNCNGSSNSTPEKTGEISPISEYYTPSNISDIKFSLSDGHQKETEDLSSHLKESLDLHSILYENSNNHNHQDSIHNETFSSEPCDHNPDSYIKLITPQIFITTNQRLPSKTKEIILNQEEINYCKTETFFEFEKPTAPVPPPLSSHLVPTSPRKTKLETPAIELNRTYTIEKRCPSLGADGKKNARQDLFAELSAAVHRRALRMSGIEPLSQSNSSILRPLLRKSDAGDKAANGGVSSPDNPQGSKKSVKSREGDAGDDRVGRLEEPRNMTVGDRNQAKGDAFYFRDSSSSKEGAIQNGTGGERLGAAFLVLESDGEELEVVDVSEDSFMSIPCCADDTGASIGSYQSCDSSTALKDKDEDEGNWLRAELRGLGVNPGPITPSTRAVYMRLLARLQQRGPLLPPPPPLERSPGVLFYPSSYCPELSAAITDPEIVLRYAELEAVLQSDFEAPRQPWRGGSAKTCFNYLLLDGRITRNLPQRAAYLPQPSDVMRQFLAAVFYVGKGQAGRPFAHLHEAFHAWQKGFQPKNPKESVILDIWRGQAGVVCVQVFHNQIPVEALTREAAMMDALGRQNLRNLRRGEYYGQAAHWSSDKQRKLGVHLLFKAKDILMRDGERAIRPYDL